MMKEELLALDFVHDVFDIYFMGRLVGGMIGGKMCWVSFLNPTYVLVCENRR